MRRVPYIPLLCVFLTTFLGSGGCGPETQCPRGLSEASKLRRKRGSYRFSPTLEKRLHRSLKKATRYLDALSIDPKKLQRAGIKGKKKLAEALDAYSLLWSAAPTRSSRDHAMRRFKDLAAATEVEGYHEMGAVSKTVFRQNSTSYLRIPFLMKRMGLDTSAYEKEIRDVLARLNIHMATRGPHQRMAFRVYYKMLGLELSPILKSRLQGGWIAKKANAYEMNRAASYSLAHEVFCLFEFGGRHGRVALEASSRRYLNRTLEILTVLAVRHRETDLLGELLTCLALLKNRRAPVYAEGLDFLLQNQKPDGSWGRYPRLRKKHGESTDVRFVLHTTLVGVEAMVYALGTPQWPGNQPDGSSP